MRCASPSSRTVGRGPWGWPPEGKAVSAMIGIVLLAMGGTLPLPGYALGQPLEDARNVVPAGKSRRTWHLRCAGDAVVPEGLEVSNAERAAGIRRCWPTENMEGAEQRTAVPRRNAFRATQELEFVGDRIVRITRVYFFSASDRVGTTITCSTDEASKIDRLQNAEGHH